MPHLDNAKEPFKKHRKKIAGRITTLYSRVFYPVNILNNLNFPHTHKNKMRKSACHSINTNSPEQNNTSFAQHFTAVPCYKRSFFVN